MHRLLIAILVLIFTMTLLPSSHLVYAEPSRTLYTCIFPDGANAGQEIVVRYDAQNAELSLVSNNTGATVQILETGLNTAQLEVRGWSSDCRYLIASLGVWGEQSTAAWDVVENRRVGTIETKGQRYGDLIWAPTNDYRLLIQSLTGAWLWHLPSNTQALLTPYSNDFAWNFEIYNADWAWHPFIEWDTKRSQLLGITLGPDSYGVTAYNIYSGLPTDFYPVNDPEFGPVMFKLFDDNNYLLVFSDFGFHQHNGQFTIWNLDTQEKLPDMTADIWSEYRRITLFSPSHRYLAILSSDLYVWDMDNLEGIEPHIPNFALDIPVHRGAASIESVRFTDNESKIQAVAYWYGLDFTIWQWDLATGERFYAKKFLETVCDDLSQLDPEDDVELVTWACGYR